MPHQCVRCNTFYDDGAPELLKGCPCGAKLFFYVKNKNKMEEATVTLTPEDKIQIEKDVRDLVGTSSEDQPVVLDIESIKVKKPGKYELDLVHLFKGEPLIYKMEDGKYMIDLPTSFHMDIKKKEEKKKK